MNPVSASHQRFGEHSGVEEAILEDTVNSLRERYKIVGEETPKPEGEEDGDGSEAGEAEDTRQPVTKEEWVRLIRKETEEMLVNASGKLVLLDKLLPKLQNDGHKVKKPMPGAL